MNIVLSLAHSVAEYDDVRMLSDLGYNVFSIGAYIDPANPGDDSRPALPDVRSFPDLAALCGDQMRSKEHLPDGVIDWADVIIVHHYLDQWVINQWERIKHKRVIWRTCGQSDHRLEAAMFALREVAGDHLQIVRYSPAEVRYFRDRAGIWAGQDALIRFGKYLGDFPAWTGEDEVVANVTQDMARRGDWCGLTFWHMATESLPARPAGTGSEDLPGGIGRLPYPELLEYLRRSRAYLYTGTLPAPYTLGFIEALAAGIPIVSIGGEAWMGPEDLWEAGELANRRTDDPRQAAEYLRLWLHDPEAAQLASEVARRQARTFDVEKIGPQWVDFLGAP